MTQPTHTPSFAQRYLDPASRLGEILFGLIMVLGATLTAGLTVAEGRPGVRQLLGSALGCNVAWGIIDGVMYVMNRLIERSARTTLVEAILRAPTPDAARDLVRTDLAPSLDSLARPEDQEAICKAIAERLGKGAAATKARVTREDLYGALACFWLVFVSCLPAAAPFLIFDHPRLALRVSNALLLAMLFMVGYTWAGYAHTSRVLTGLAMVVIGLALVGVTILLGG